MAFFRVDDYRAPQWPDTEHPKQFHLDFEVDDIDAEQARVIGLGATLRKDFVGPEGYGWRIFTDPIGHPFCLCRNKGVVWTDEGRSGPGGTDPEDEAALRGAERRLGRRLPGPLADVLRKNGGGVVDAYGTDVVWPLERIVEENLSFWSGEAFAGLYMPFGTTAG